MDALAAGVLQCDGLELDVRFSSDGVPVLVHDATLDRLFGVAARVNALSVGDLERIGVATLAEALAGIPPSTPIDVELKERPSSEFYATILGARGPQASGIVISSFDRETLRDIHRDAPGWSRWLNAETMVEAEGAALLGCTGVAVEVGLLSDDAISGWRAAGLEVAAWTIRGCEGARWADDRRLVALCVEGEGIVAARAVAR